MAEEPVHGDPVARRDRLSELAGGFRVSAAILSANELGVFRELSESGKTAEEMAVGLEVSPRGLELLLDALAALDLVVKRDRTYFLHGDAEEFLREGARYYLGDIFRHNMRLMKKWAHLDEVVRSGRPWQGRTPVNERSEDDLRSFILGMENISRTSAEETADGLELRGLRRMLDLGGGPGTYLLSFLRREPGARGVLLDFPRVVEIAREQVEAAGMIDRIDFIEGDMHTADYDGEYDLVFLGNIIHSFGPGANRSLVQRCAKALEPGGRLVIKDFFLDDTGTSPLHAALFSLNMLSGTEEGRAYRRGEVSEWMADAGLDPVQSFRVGRHSGVLVARKNR